MLNAKFQLDCYEELKQFMLDEMKDKEQQDLYITRPVLPQHLLDKLNEELYACELPRAEAFVAFKRRNFIYSSDESPSVSEIRGMHLDSNIYKEILNVSLILPIEGCEDTYMYYAGGKFETRFNFAADGKTIRAMIDWQEEPYILDKVSIVDTPVMSRVDIPHDACSRRDGQFRTTLTIRLRNNPTFDEVYSKFFQHGKIVDK